MKIIASSILLGTVCLFSACHSRQLAQRTYKDFDTVSISANNNPNKLYRAAAPMDWRIVHTRVALSFDYAAQTANGQEWVTLQPYFYPTDSLCLDAKGMKIESVTIGYADKPLAYTYDSSQLHIRLDRVYTQNEQLKLAIKYVAMPYAMATGGSVAITDDRGLYFINADQKIQGKPVQIWTQGETESNSHWLPTIDKPNMRTTLQLELTVPAQYTTLSNGALISSANKGKVRTDIWYMDQPIQVYAIMFAVGDFVVTKDKWKDKEVSYYVEPAYAGYAKQMFQYTPEMIGFFSDITGVPYPWNKYSQVVVRDYVSGAMENTSASLFGAFMHQDTREYNDNNHEDVVSHELFHQWFGDYATAESWSNLTVNESFANYGEYLWRKHKYGQAYADELRWSDLQKYLNYVDYSDPALVRYHYRDKEDMFDLVSYQKGGATLHYLHHLLGDSAFYQSMKLYLSKNALQATEATHWRLAVEQATGKDWQWFFNQWYYKAGHPILKIDYDYDDAAQKLTVNIKQTQDQSVGLYQLPLQALLVSGMEHTNIDWNIEKAEQHFVYAYKNGIRPLIVPDIAHVLPGVIEENKTIKEYLLQMQHCNDYVSQLLAMQQINAKNANLADAKAIISLGLNNKQAALRLAAVQTLKRWTIDAKRAQWIDDVQMIAANDGNNNVRAAAIDLLGYWKVAAQKQLLIDATKDISYQVAGDALQALSKIDDTMAYTLAKTYLNAKANTHLDTKAWAVYSAHAHDEDTALFRKYVYAKDDAQQRAHLCSDLMSFGLRTQNETVFQTILDLYSYTVLAAVNKNTRSYYVRFLQAFVSNVSGNLQKDKKNVLLSNKSQLLKALVVKLKAREKDAEIIKLYEQILL